MIMLDYKRILVPYDGSEYARRKAFHCDRFPADAADGKNRAGKSICL